LQENLADELAELRGLDPTTLRQRWRVLYRTEAPVRIGQTLLLPLTFGGGAQDHRDPLVGAALAQA
jgi:hypothetical protein